VIKSLLHVYPLGFRDWVVVQASPLPAPPSQI
jgi:hypothetical protein